MYQVIYKLLSLIPPETAHKFSLSILNAYSKLLFIPKATPKNDSYQQQIMGIKFSNVIGIAAGMDNNGDYISGLTSLNPGFIELGGITPLAQPGNPKPRLFRLTKEQGIINCKGFPNFGVDNLILNLKLYKSNFKNFLTTIGVNIAKNLHTPLDLAYKDYLYCYEKLYQYVDFITVNVSSPNTPGLHKLQQQQYIDKILVTLKEQQIKLEAYYNKHVPLLIKLSPDLEDTAITTIIKKLINNNWQGVVLTNTSANHNYKKSGGVSGRPITERSRAKLKVAVKAAAGKLSIISSGGILTTAEAKLRLELGADLLQIYSGLIYNGPGFINKILANIN